MEFLGQLKAILSPEQLRTDSASLAEYGSDWLKHYSAAPSGVLFPDSVEQIQKVVSLAYQTGTALVPSGGRTGLSGGATAINGEFILSLEKLNKLLEIDSIQKVALCSAGVVTERVQIEAAKHNLQLPIDFASKGSSQIGGNVATNAGGIKVVRYGTTRRHVRGLKVVTGTGELLEFPGGLVKNQTGYDLKQLFIGSEGTLGVIVEVTIALLPRPQSFDRVLCGFNELSKISKILERLLAQPTLSMLEYFDRASCEKIIKHHSKKEPFDKPYPGYLLIEFEGHEASAEEQITEVLSDLLEQELVSDAIIPQNSKQADEILQYRELISETLSSHYDVHKNDISVAPGDLARFIPELQNLCGSVYPQSETVIYGHIGDGNLHLNVLRPQSQEPQSFFKHCKESDPEVLGLVAKYSGSISAEHGVGMLKKEHLGLSRTEVEIDIMREIKKIFDPKGILNPGKIFD